MTRTLALIMAIFILAFPLVGCNKKEEKPTNIIKTGELTQEQKDILNLTGTQAPRLYDFEVKGARSMKLEILTLENGGWVCHSSSLVAASNNSESYKGQIALMLTDPDDPFGGYSIAITDADGFSRSTHEPEPIGKKYPDHSTASIVENHFFKLNEPVGLIILYGSEKSPSSQISYFPDEALAHPEEIDSDIARLLAVTFYDKSVSEVEEQK